MNDELPTKLAIKAGADLTYLRDEFAETGCIQIPAFIDEQAAVALQDHVAACEDWHIALLAGGETPLNIRRPVWRAMTPAQREALIAMASPTECHGFRFLFEELIIVGDDFRNCQTGTQWALSAISLGVQPS